MKRRSSWDALSSKAYHETARGRDVYNDQQLDRKDLPEMQTMTLRLVLAGIASLLAGFLFYTAWAIIAASTAGLNAVPSDTAMSSDVSDTGQSAGGDYGNVQEPPPGQSDLYGEGYPENGSGEGGTGSVISESSWDNVINNLAGQSSGSDDASNVEEPVVSVTEAEGSGSVWDGVIDNLEGNPGPDGTVTEPQGNVTQEPVQSTGQQSVLTENAQSSATSGTSSAEGISVEGSSSFYFHWYPYSIDQVFFTLLVTFGTFALMYEVLKRNLKAQNMLSDTTDINQYKNDQHIMLPEEIHRKFDWFPDSGAHADVTVNCIISHSMISNKGIEPIEMTSRYSEDMTDPETGEIVVRKGEPVLDENGDVVVSVKPMFDRKFANALYDSVDVHSKDRIFYNPRRIPYNPAGKRGKKKYDTVADFINNEWDFPEYEVQRPGGAYLVDTDPVNVLVLAITRAGKGWWFGPLTHFYRYQRGIGFYCI